MTFDQVLDRLRGWVGTEVFIVVEERAAATPIVYVKGILHPPQELSGAEKGGGEEQFEFDVGVAREISIELWRASFVGAEGDDLRVRMRCGSAVIRIGTDVA
jgi:hypothetical protein